MGGSLLEINSQDEQDTITRHLRADQKLKKEYPHWIGLNDKDKEREWVWETSHTLLNGHYQNWDKYQPDDFGGEDCVRMKKVGESRKKYPLKWNDANCNRISYAICEKGDYRFLYHISLPQNYQTV